jgi:septal ring factor EnvC (AmiA/AmiB activator)
MQMPRSRLNFIFLCYKQKTIDMATRKEDITVRIVADYAKAEADVQRFIGGASKSFAAIPASVNAATQSVDKLTSQLARNDAAMQTLPKHLQDISSAVDRLNQTVDKMGQLSGPDKLKNKLRETSDEASKLSKMMNGVATAGSLRVRRRRDFRQGKMVLAPQLEKMMSYESKLCRSDQLGQF